MEYNLNDDFEFDPMFDIPEGPLMGDDEVILAPEPLPANDEELAMVAEPPEVLQYNSDAPDTPVFDVAGIEAIPEVVSTLHVGHISHAVADTQVCLK